MSRARSVTYEDLDAIRRALRGIEEPFKAVDLHARLPEGLWVALELRELDLRPATAYRAVRGLREAGLIEEGGRVFLGSGRNRAAWYRATDRGHSMAAELKAAGVVP